MRSPKISKYKVLVVDDDATIRESLTMLLTEEGYEVTTAAHGFDGSSAAQAFDARRNHL